METVTPVTEQPAPVTENHNKTPFHIAALEAAYYVTVASACYGFTLSMPGFHRRFFRCCLRSLSFAALQMVKDSSIPKTAGIRAEHWFMCWK